eukprot:TRINITY_DN17879_c0_g1_i1.p1 TRINITY_DN17879_c0_g1~~TRINITY_DN17879_c0_g1_i1.p1  ORF type:complete len:215 (-),score=41.70 TRINITY_DN17879_c0_g1_i1:97-741(-)
MCIRDRVSTQSTWAILDIITQDKSILTKEIKNDILSIYSIAPFQTDKLLFINKVLTKFYQSGDEEICKVVTIDLLNQKQYYLAQKYLTNVNDLQLSTKLIELWTQGMKQEEAEYIILRLILLKILTDKLQESSQIFQKLQLKSPIGNIIKFLIKALELKSYNAFQLIQKQYLPIFQKDPFIFDLMIKVQQKYFPQMSQQQFNFAQSIMNFLFEN